jgi:hypothetical protein
MLGFFGHVLFYVLFSYPTSWAASLMTETQYVR